jgi:hypothetical protein
MFKAAAAGAAGVNFHAGVHNRHPGDDKAYTPIARGAGGRGAGREACASASSIWNPARGARVTLDAGRSFAASSLLRLAGPAADAKAGITLGGASVDDFGRWTPATAEGAPVAGREVSVMVCLLGRRTPLANIAGFWGRLAWMS